MYFQRSKYFYRSRRYNLLENYLNSLQISIVKQNYYIKSILSCIGMTTNIQVCGLRNVDLYVFIFIFPIVFEWILKLLQKTGQTLQMRCRFWKICNSCSTLLVTVQLCITANDAMTVHFWKPALLYACAANQD